jgi:hypothetical protein
MVPCGPPMTLRNFQMVVEVVETRKTKNEFKLFYLNSKNGG